MSQVWSYGEAPGERLYAGFQGGAMRLPRTGNTFITYGGVCSINGKPASGPDRFDPGEADLRDKIDICARLIEVTPDNEIVLDLTVGGGPTIRRCCRRSAPNTSRHESALPGANAERCVSRGKPAPFDARERLTITANDAAPGPGSARA